MSNDVNITQILCPNVYEKMMNSKHVWKKRSYDETKIDDFVTDYGHHNGPGCIVCGYTFCEHCMEGHVEEFNEECISNPDNDVVMNRIDNEYDWNES